MVESNISRAERAVNALSDISFAEGQNEPVLVTNSYSYWSPLEAVLVGAVTSTGRFFAFVKP